MSPVDSVPEPKYSLPEPEQLDYALLRVDGTPGNDAVGNQAGTLLNLLHLPVNRSKCARRVPNIHPNTALFHSTASAR